jgi:hypothetical protein
MSRKIKAFLSSIRLRTVNILNPQFTNNILVEEYVSLDDEAVFHADDEDWRSWSAADLDGNHRLQAAKIIGAIRIKAWIVQWEQVRSLWPVVSEGNLCGLDRNIFCNGISYERIRA